jgi:histidinol-phosphatase (PHP family)
MLTTDFHLHTNISVDSSASIDEMIQKAVDLGFTEVAITDHVDHNPADDGAGMYDPDKAFQATLAARERFARRIAIRHGAELGEPHFYAKENERLLKLPLDMVIGSVHCMGNFGVHSDLFDKISPPYAIRNYFQLMQEMVSQADIDVLGHLDYFDRYTAPRNIPAYNPDEYKDQIIGILKTIVSRNLALEVNTSGFRPGHKPPRTFPHPRVLTWYYEMGGRSISIGSDAHLPEHVGLGFDETARLLQIIGFREYHVYRARKPFPVPIT